MITSKHINKIIAVIVLIAIVFTTLLMFNSQALNVTAENESPEYAAKLFNKDKIISIDIKADPDEFNKLIENAQSEEYISCDVTINGTTFYSVGIRPKGNSSLSMIAGNSESDRFSFKFEFDHYIEGQTYFGLDKFVVNNIQADATYMKEYLSYELMNAMGVPTPLYAYTDVMVNGEPWGFYLAVESLEESFAERSFGSNAGFLYKPESMNMGGAPQKQPAQNGQKNSINASQTIQAPDIQNADMTSGGSDLKYTDDNLSSYSDLFDYAVFKSTDTDHQRVIEALKKLSEGTELEKYIDVDEVLRYFAVNTVLVNLDSYVSNMKHNYYLYEQNGQLSILPWDFNLAFGGFQAGSSTSAVNFPIDTPSSGIELSERPLLAKLLEVDEYKNKYHDYLREIVSGPLKTSLNTIDQIDILIKDHVKNDASAFYTYDEYLSAVSILKEFIELRIKSIEGQLSGSIPSTTAGQSESPKALIDASSINLSALGTQGGGEGGPGGGKAWNMIPGGNAPPNMPQNNAMPDRQIMSQAIQNKPMPNGANIDSGQAPSRNMLPTNAPAGNVTDPLTSKQNVLLTAICAVSMTVSLVLIATFKRKKYSR